MIFINLSPIVITQKLSGRLKLIFRPIILAAVKKIANATGAEIMAHVGDFSNASFQYSEVHDGESFAMGGNGPVVKVMHSPGHTPGSTSYIIDDKYFISGDTIFILSVGRPDLGGKAKEWSAMLYDTLTIKS
jgi:Zn-dependent hydrolases, including glyoxylases